MNDNFKDMFELHGVIKEISREEAKKIIKENHMKYSFTTDSGREVFRKYFACGAPDCSCSVSLAPGVRS